MCNKVAFIVLQLVVFPSAVYSQNISCEFQNGCVFNECGIQTNNRTAELLCCDKTTTAFRLYWNNGITLLSAYLNAMKIQNCPQFKEECNEMTYAYTEFSRMIYLKFCNQSTLEFHCSKNIHQVLKPPVDNNSLSWRNAVEKIEFNTLSDEELNDPCLQIAMLDTALSDFRKIFVVVPFCGITWCGFNEQEIKSRSITPWTCMAPR